MDIVYHPATVVKTQPKPQAARRPRVYIETISIWCPACEEDVENPEPGMGHIFNQDEFDRLPQVFKCQCGATIKKPRNPW